MVGGHLVSSAFLQRHLQARADAQHFAGRRHLAGWRSGCAWLGPASSLRAMVETGIQPLVRLLGFPGLRDLEYGEGAAAASLDAAQTLAILVTAWSQPLDGLWRMAVVEAQRRE